MTAAEQREFEELKSTIKQQAEWIISQKEMTEMPCPSWAKDASKYYKPYWRMKKAAMTFGGSL